MIDTHTHTLFSCDSKENPEESIQRAIDVGCNVFGFSEHYDYDYVVENIEVVMTDIDAYYKNTQILKKKFENRIKLLCGIEFGYNEKAEKHYLETLKKYDFDYVINSVHIANGKDCYFLPYFEGKTKKDAYTDYLNCILRSVYAKFDYQIIGHLGYVVRNAPYEDARLYYDEYEKLIKDILKGIIEREKVLEINTRINSSYTLTLPTYEIISKYYEMGGRLICFGSDAHSKDSICKDYNPVSDMLKSIGFKEFVYFEKKVMKTYPLK